MILLAAILHVWLPGEPQPNDSLALSRLKRGHMGFTVIALVYVLVAFWQL